VEASHELDDGSVLGVRRDDDRRLISSLRPISSTARSSARRSFGRLRLVVVTITGCSSEWRH
jgi:hypothetical protein